MAQPRRMTHAAPQSTTLTGTNVGLSRNGVREFDSRGDWDRFTSAVSLHAHTHHSREVMADLPRYITRVPVVGTWFERERQAFAEREGRDLDFSKGHWHPPVSPRALFESEVEQIERRFGLAPLISVTDHDSIAAGLELQRLYAPCRSPISFEWTVPWARGFFHLGIHNIPGASAHEWYARLSSMTAHPSPSGVVDLLADLARERTVLIVFNHPLWDLAGVGAVEHQQALRGFVGAAGRSLHALELNGTGRGARTTACSHLPAHWPCR